MRRAPVVPDSQTNQPVLGRPAGTGEDAVGDVAAVHAALGEPARLVLVRLLARHGSLCVCELQAALPLAQPTVSHHLKVLREAGLVEAERRGTWVYYRLRREPLKRLLSHLVTLL
ncbi:Arsenic resistance transcriptional regulator ArsR1 [bacterium HR32]|jgi:ArsR family transcriptional regulator|nr:Arsenic resistance transcriptional regulator ArsR1 [bacterium HR32]